MKKRYKIKPTVKYLRKEIKLSKKNPALKSRIDNTLRVLQISPFSSKLKTHKVGNLDRYILWSSRVTGDIRIIWVKDNDNITIVLIDIGGHDRIYERN